VLAGCKSTNQKNNNVRRGKKKEIKKEIH
jgi:hypothetical protein